MAISYIERHSRYIAINDDISLPFNLPLYHLFSMDKNHVDSQFIAAKIYYVSRMYKANFELNIARLKNPYVQNIEEFVTAATRGPSKFCEILRRQRRPYLSKKSIEQYIVDVTDLEAEVRTLLGRADGQGKGFWSFCSKYMHFHTGVAPLFDTNARVSLCKILTCYRARINRKGTDASLTYDEYVRGFMNLLAELHADDGVRATNKQVKALDGFLVSMFRSDKAKGRS